MSYKPTNTNDYLGKQVIINSDRLLFNAKDDSILLFSDKAIGFSTNGSIHFDTGDKEKDCFFVINSPDIYIGLDGNEYPTEPGVLGDKNEEWLNKLVTQLKEICKILDTSYSHTGDRGGSTTAKPAFQGVSATLDELLSTLPEIKSKHVYLKT